jgi:hypothetical protein
MIRRTLSFLALLALSGLSLFGAVQAVRFGLSGSAAAPSEEYRASIADRELRETVLSPGLRDRPPAEQAAIAEAVARRLDRGGWKLAPRRLKDEDRRQLQQNLAILAVRWLSARAEEWDALAGREREETLDRHIARVVVWGRRAEGLPERDRDAYLESRVLVATSWLERKLSREAGQAPDLAVRMMQFLPLLGARLPAVNDLDAEEQQRLGAYLLAVWRRLPAHLERGDGS